MAQIIQAVFVSFIFANIFLCAEGALDIKAFLGEKPLTTKRVVEDVLLYFQQDDPHGIPVLTIPDPMHLEGEYQASSIVMENVTISGHGQLRLKHLGVNLEELKAQIRIGIPRLEILSTYVWPSYFSNSYGDMNVTITFLEIGLVAHLGVNEEGIIQVENLDADISKEEFNPHLEGLTFQHNLIVSAADTLFDSVVVPLIQSLVSSKALVSVNEKLKERLADRKFPADISPVDFMVAKLRNDYMKKKNLDPFIVEERELDLPLPVSLVLKKASVEGLSTLHRDKEISVELIDNRIYARVELSTKAVKMSGDWSLYTSLVPLGGGRANITVDGLTIAIHLQQDADVRHPPILRDIDIELGNLGLLSSGEKNLDYFLEASVNIFPNIFKNIILDRKVEGFLKQRIQERFNFLDLEGIIKSRIEAL